MIVNLPDNSRTLLLIFCFSGLFIYTLWFIYCLIGLRWVNLNSKKYQKYVKRPWKDLIDEMKRAASLNDMTTLYRLQKIANEYNNLAAYIMDLYSIKNPITWYKKWNEKCDMEFWINEKEKFQNRTIQRDEGGKA